MRDDYWTLSFPRLTQGASSDFYPDHTKDDTMTTDQPAWATDPRGLPPAVHTEPHELIWILDTENGTYTYHPLSPRTPAQLDRQYGPVTPLWPDSPPTSPLPDLSRWHKVPKDADIPAGTRYAFVRGTGGWGAGQTGRDYRPGQRWNWDYYTEHPTPAPNAWATDRIGPWSDSQPTPIDPAEIKVGMRVRRVLRHKDGDRTTTTESTVTAVHPRLITLSGFVYHLATGGDWFLIADAPDDDDHWVRAIAEATPETAATVYAAIKGEQA